MCINLNIAFLVRMYNELTLAVLSGVSTQRGNDCSAVHYFGTLKSVHYNTEVFV